MTVKLSASFNRALRTFSYRVAAGSLGQPVLDGVDHRFVLSEEPSALEQVYANVVELDEDGRSLNAKHAERRAALWLRSYIERGFVVVPRFEDWETALHDPPPRVDPGTA